MTYILFAPLSINRWTQFRQSHLSSSANLVVLSIFGMSGGADVVLFFVTRRGLLLFGRDDSEDDDVLAASALGFRGPDTIICGSCGSVVGKKGDPSDPELANQGRLPDDDDDPEEQVEEQGGHDKVEENGAGGSATAGPVSASVDSARDDGTPALAATPASAAA